VDYKEEELHALLSAIWAEDVIKCINDVLDANHYFGFRHFEIFADPSIEDISHSLGVIETALTVFLENKQINVESESILINCQQGVHLIRRVFSSLRRKDQDEYDDALRKLQGHAGTYRALRAEFERTGE